METCNKFTRNNISSFYDVIFNGELHLGAQVRMTSYIKLLLILICTSIVPCTSVADTTEMAYQPVGQISSTQLPLGQWMGLVSFQNIYCATFPNSTLAQRVDQAFFKNKTVFWMSVLYVDNTVASIAVSTIPENQSPEDAIEKILNNERSIEAELSKRNVNYKVEEAQTPWGSSINIKATNLARSSPYGPFPLTRTVAVPTNPDSPSTSKSVHSLFVKGHDRFEIAIMSSPKFTTSSAQDKAEDAELISMLNQLVIDLHFCTSQMKSNNSAPFGQ